MAGARQFCSREEHFVVFVQCWTRKHLLACLLACVAKNNSNYTQERIRSRCTLVHEVRSFMR